jgi:hypothetical protein
LNPCSPLIRRNLLILQDCTTARTAAVAQLGHTQGTRNPLAFPGSDEGRRTEEMFQKGHGERSVALVSYGLGRLWQTKKDT